MTTLTSEGAEKIRPTDGGADSQAFGGAMANNTEYEATRPIPRSYNAIIDASTSAYLDALDPGKPPHPWNVEADLLDSTNRELRIENAGRKPGTGKRPDANDANQLPLLRTLTSIQVARVLAHFHRVIRLTPIRGGRNVTDDKDPIVVYDAGRGVYTHSIDEITRLASLYALPTASFLRDLDTALRVHTPRVSQRSTHEWAAVRNGDYHRATKMLHPFSPERVFLTRGAVNYVPDARNPTIRNESDGTDWDVDSGILEIANGDAETEQQIWELLAAVAQPNVRTNKAVALYNPRGNNGKGTVLQLCGSIAGPDSTIHASIATLAKDVTLPLLAGKSLVLSDENATNDFHRNAEVIKTLATREPFFVNPKYKPPYNATFEGNQVHCLNELPRFADHSPSMWRRWLFISLVAKFEGRDRRYIKDDYLYRSEVLEYVLKRALEMDFTDFTETESNRALKELAILSNDAARLFWAEHKSDFVWNLLPLTWLYDVFKAWFAENKPAGRVMDRNTFVTSIRAVVEESDSGWVDLGTDVRRKAAAHMSDEEPLNGKYGLTEWMHIPKDKQFRNVLLRDAVGRALSSVAPVSVLAASPRSASAPAPRSSALAAVNQLREADIQRWTAFVLAEDGPVSPQHLREHTLLRRGGSTCGCSSAPQKRAADSLYEYARQIDEALMIARMESEELLEAA